MAYRRYRSKSRFRRRYGRRIFKKSKKNIRRRIIRRALVRRPLKPELKWMYEVVAPLATPANNWVTRSLTSTTLGSGVTTANRIGQEVMFRNIVLRLTARDNSGNTGATAPVVPDGLRRCVLWTPRVAIETANTYLTNTSPTLETVFDHNIMTIHRDWVFSLGAAYVDLDNQVTGVLAAGTYRNSKLINVTIPFPRKAKFRQGDTTVDPNKDVMYILMINGALATSYSWNAKIFFTDA